jgi:hypothetical protein
MTDSRAVSFKYTQIGRYLVFRGIGAGGMASVRLARFFGSAGSSRVVAVKHLPASCRRCSATTKRRSTLTIRCNDALFDGLLDDFRIYKRASTAAEILALP